MTKALGTLSRPPGGLATGVFEPADGGVMTGVVITRKTLSSTFFAMDTMAFWAADGTLCRLLLILHHLPGTLAHKPLGQACHCRGELVQPAL